jgi:hypothetical protein
MQSNIIFDHGVLLFAHDSFNLTLHSLSHSCPFYMNLTLTSICLGKSSPHPAAILCRVDKQLLYISSQ